MGKGKKKKKSVGTKTNGIEKKKRVFACWAAAIFLPQIPIKASHYFDCSSTVRDTLFLFIFCFFLFFFVHNSGVTEEGVIFDPVRKEKKKRKFGSAK